MNKTLTSLIFAGSLLVPSMASAEVWIFGEELDGKTRNIKRSTVHGFESRGQCLVAANELMGTISKKDGFELAIDPFDHETMMGKRGGRPKFRI